MFSNVKKLEDLLIKLSDSIKQTEKKRYTANQMLKASDINLAEGATLTINMNNTILSMELINQCLDVVNELKFLLPMRDITNLNDALDNYRDTIITKALEKTRGKKSEAIELLGLTKRQFRYIEHKKKEENNA